MAEIQIKLSADSRKFLDYINAKRCNSRLPINFNHENDTYSNPEDIVNEFSRYFARSFVKPQPVTTQHIINAVMLLTLIPESIKVSIIAVDDIQIVAES